MAEDGNEAWETFQELDVDVVISDWMMPGMDGDELCRRVRVRPDAPYAYFILLTSLDDRSTWSRAWRRAPTTTSPSPSTGGRSRRGYRRRAGDRAPPQARRRQQTELERLNGTCSTDSRRDPSPALGNRRARTRISQCSPTGPSATATASAWRCSTSTTSRRYNDSAGHLAGDDVLRSVAGALPRQRRRGDAVYRYGGEELLVVFPEQTLETAAIAAERMREVIESLGIPHPGLEQGRW